MPGSDPSESAIIFPVPVRLPNGRNVNLASLVRNPATWLGLAIFLLAVFCYYPGLSGDYMFDDRTNLLENRDLNLQSLSLDDLESAAFSSNSGALHRPVSMLSFALNRYFFGISPWSYKVINLAIHLLTGLGLWWLGSLIIRSLRRREDARFTPVMQQWLPLAVAGLWLVHPLNLTAILYIVQRMTGLAALFTVYGLILYLTGRLRLLDGRHGLPHILAGLVIFGSLAVLSKENGVLLPLYMLVLELTLFRFRTDSGKPQRGIVAFFVLLVLLPGIAALTYLFTHASTYLNYSGRDFTLAQRLLTEPRVLLFYLKLIFMPTVQELGLYHDDIRVSHGLLDPPTTLYSILTLAALLAAAVALLRKAPLVSLGILWFFAGHALESTIIPLEIAHEHRNYLADYGILLGVAGLLTGLTSLRHSPKLCAVLPALFFVLFGYTTWVRSSQWSDNVDQAVYEAQHHPESARAVFAAGRIHARLAVNGRKASIVPAFDYLKKASRLGRDGIMPDVTMIKLAALLHRPINPAWYDKVVEKLNRHPLTPSDIMSLQDLTECAGSTCHIPVEMMEKIFAASLRIENAPMLTAYGYYSINQRGNFPKGLALFRRAVQRDPKESQYWKNLIDVLVAMHRFDEAEQQLHKFSSLDLPQATDDDLRTLQDKIDRARLEQVHNTGKNPENTGS